MVRQCIRNILLIYSVLTYSIIYAAAAPKPVLLIADTNGQAAHCYRNLIHMARNAGFSVQYKNLYDLLQLTDINQYDALFFMISPRMLSMSSMRHLFNRFMCALPLNYASSIPEHCWNLLRSFAKQHDKALAIMLPGHINYSKTLKQQSVRAIERLGCFEDISPDTKQSIRNFVKHITRPDAATGALFGTSLIPAQEKQDADNDEPPQMQQTNNPTTGVTESVCAPFNTTHYSERAQHSFPLGLVLRSPIKNKTFLIGKASDFTFADIAEHLFKNPFNIVNRNELLQAAQETLSLFCTAHATKKIPNTIPHSPVSEKFKMGTLQQKNELVEAMQKRYCNTSLYKWMLTKKIALAWLDPYDFYGHEDAHQAIRHALLAKNSEINNESLEKKQIESIALTRGVQLIYHAQFDALWFEFLPEWYLSSHGLRKAQREEYIRRIKGLGIALKSFFARHKKPLPKIVLGMNLTSNFRTEPVANPVKDVYGNTYTKIPSPFDMTHFWKPEMLDVFDTFITTFQKSFPIDAVFFDLEMYHAPEQAGMYTDLMDFSDKAWQTYCLYTKNNDVRTLSSVKKRVRYLQQEKRFAEYFAILEQASKELGKTIKNYLRKKQPHLLFGAYVPTLPYSWFYRGFLAGLSSESEPILLATFNTDYASHYNWLIKQGIYCIHGGALMLSKLKTKKDFNLIPHLQTIHNFVWYNRPSRMIYEYNQEQLGSVWWGIEATAHNPQKAMHYIKAHHSNTAPSKNRS